MSALPLLVSHPPKPGVVRAMSKELGLSRDETSQALDLLKRGLPPLTRRSWIPFLFGVSPKMIGSMETRSDRYYRRFVLSKKSGGSREIVTPRRFLKTIQRWLLHRVFTELPRSQVAHAFVEGRSIFTNAAPHLHGKNLMVLDIRNFFPSVTESRVTQLLLEHLPFPDPVAHQLARLCTLAGRLPQGAPTSPALANLAFHGADLELSQIVQDWGVSYSRYADDLAFSGGRCFSQDDVKVVAEVVSGAGFEIHTGKTRIIGGGARQVVAGIVVNEKGLPPRVTRRRWRAMFHRAARHPHEFSARVAHLLGVASFVKQYDPGLAQQYSGVAEQVRLGMH